MKPFQLDHDIFDMNFWNRIKSIHRTRQYDKVYYGLIKPIHDSINNQISEPITTHLIKSYIK